MDMSLDEEFEKLHEKYANSIELKELSIEEKSNVRQQYFSPFCSYYEPEKLLAENRVKLHHYFAIYYSNNKIDLNKAEKYFELAVAAADDYNPNTEPEFHVINGIECQVKKGIPQKGNCLKILGNLYRDWGFNLAENNKERKAVEKFKKSIAYLFNNEASNPIEILQQYIPRKVYSYRPVSKYLLHDLINKEITFASPEEFNDPVDCPFLSILRRKREEIDESEKLTLLIEAYKFLKIRCFVSNLKVNGEVKDKELVEEYKNSLMWSHYADSHRGICVKYHIKGNFLVNVEKEGIASRWIDVDCKQKEFIYKKGNNSFTIKEAFATKANHWEYEKELRLFHYDPNCNTPFKALPLGQNGNVEAVYFGLKCPQKDIETIRGILTEDVAYFQMKEDDEDIFMLVEAPLNQKAEALLAAAAVAVTASVTVE
jgi:hypothetical protein